MDIRALHRQHAPTVARICASFEANPEAARELEQDVWLAAWRAAPSFRGDASPRTWLLRIAHYAAVRHVSRQHRSPLQRPLEGIEDLPETEPGPDEQADRSIVQARLRSAIGRLKPLDRMLVLGWLEGLDTRELALLTGLSSTHVTTKLHRLRKHLTVSEDP